MLIGQLVSFAGDDLKDHLVCSVTSVTCQGAVFVD